MNSAEKIQTAIAELEALKAASTQGKWAVSAKQLDIRGFVYAPSVCAGCGWDRDTDADAELIVTLHRTIDAQLKILRTTLDDEHADWLTELEWRNSVALAEAILE